jgi:folylpolyglutamate synthase/dihydropteroate synthase
MVWVEEMRHCGRIYGTSYFYFEFLPVLAKHVVHERSVEVAVVVSGLGMRLYYDVLSPA